MKCSNCGAEFEDGFNFCPMCGTRAERAGDTPHESHDKGQAAKAARPEDISLAGEICRFACAALNILFAIIALCTLAAPAIKYGYVTVATGYGWIANIEAQWRGFPVTMLIFAILIFVSGGLHIALLVRENKNGVTAMVAKTVLTRHILAAADLILLLTCTTVSAVAFYFAENLAGEFYSGGAALLCPMIIGIIFFVAEIAAFIYDVIKRYAPYTARAPFNARPAALPAAWADLPEDFTTPRTVKAAHICRNEYALRLITAAISIIASSLAIALLFKIGAHIIQYSADADPVSNMAPGVLECIAAAIWLGLYGYTPIFAKTRLRRLNINTACFIFAAALWATNTGLSAAIAAAGNYYPVLAQATAIISSIAFVLAIISAACQLIIRSAATENGVNAAIDGGALGKTWSNLYSLNEKLYSQRIKN